MYLFGSSQANAPLYYEVDMGRPLGSQLAGKLVVEYPMLVGDLDDLI